MADMIVRDVEYSHDGSRMLGYLCAPSAAVQLPGIVLVHDAFGLNEDMIGIARRYAALGFAVFAADVWGDRMTPTSGAEIGPLIGGMVRNRNSWLGRIRAAHDVAAEQPEINGAALVTIGYCFGGSSALEHVRTGGDVLGAVSVHGGLDLLDPSWDQPATAARVLLCTGADDPMATAEMRSQLQESMSGAGLDWELDLYSDTQHAFTNPRSDAPGMPDGVAYNPRSADRAWKSTKRFLGELFPHLDQGAE